MTKEEIQAPAWKCWEKVNNEIQGGINPTPFVLGYRYGVLSDTARKHWEPKWINEDCPKDGTHIMRMHKIYKCLISVYYNKNHSEQLKICQWIESTKSNSWPNEAFENGYIILPTFND